MKKYKGPSYKTSTCGIEDLGSSQNENSVLLTPHNRSKSLWLSLEWLRIIPDSRVFICMCMGFHGAYSCYGLMHQVSELISASVGSVSIPAKCARLFGCLSAARRFHVLRHCLYKSNWISTKNIIA